MQVPFNNVKYNKGKDEYLKEISVKRNIIFNF